MNSKLPKNNSSGIKGVCFDNRRQLWRAHIKINQKQIHLGYFIQKDDAIKARRLAEAKYFKEFQYKWED
jgi:hypothetical protein